MPHSSFGVCVCLSLLYTWAWPEAPASSSWSRRGRTADTETEMCAVSVLRATAVWKEDQRNWTRSLTWRPSPKSSDEQGWMSFIQETLAGRCLFLSCFHRHSRIWDDTSSSSSGTCVISRITAPCITVGGERPSYTYPHLAAWAQQSDWYPCCRPSFGPCSTSWKTPQPASHSEVGPLMTTHNQYHWMIRPQREWNRTVKVLIHLFIQNFRKKRKIQEILRYTFGDGMSKILHLSYRCEKLWGLRYRARKETV